VKRNGCLIGCGAAVLGAMVLVAIVIVAASQLLGPALDVSSKIQQNSNGQVINTSYSWYNGVGEFQILLAPGTTPSQARDIACQIVRPALRGTKFEGTKFEELRADGWILADETTPCG
jgi:hypothetical protein